jgi:glycosyltransferase involved in cell wall biosynthesis
MVDFFNELGKLCDLTVLFEKSKPSNRDISWNDYKFDYFKGIIMKGISTRADAAFCPQIIRYITKKYDHIIVTNQSTLTGVLAILYMKLRGIRYILESEGGFAKSGAGFKEKVKKRLLSNAYYYFSTTKIGDEYFLKYGAKRERILKYPFTSIYNHEILPRMLTENERNRLKLKYGLENKKVVIAVGRFIPLKHFEDLIKAFRFGLNQYTLLLIGGGELYDEYKKLINVLSHNNIILMDFLSKKELMEYYKLSDLFVHPTSTDCWGLVINEAMAMGLPIITTNMCIAGTELIKDDWNGYLVDVGDIEGMYERMKFILENDNIRYMMGSNSLEKIKWYTLEKMAEVHINHLRRISDEN